MKRDNKPFAPKLVLVSALLLGGGITGGNSYAATASSSASATVVGDPVSLNDSTPGLSVSTFVSDSTGDLLIRIPGDGLCATSGGAEDVTAPSFTAIGDENARRTMTMADFIALTSGNGTLTGTSGRPTSGTTPVVCGGDGRVIKPSPMFSTVLVGPANVSGPNAGTFSVTVVFN
jgi:hypothetical protein